MAGFRAAPLTPMSGEGTAGLGASAGHVLVLCTGNICRSPYVEHLLRAALSDTGHTVESAGTGAVVGSGMHPESLRLLADAGIDGSAFRARQLVPDLVRSADLIIGATREHAASVGWMMPDAFDRAHSLGDLAQSLKEHTLDLTPGMGLPRLVSLVAGHRRAGRLHRSSERTDVVDPYLQPQRTWEQMDAQIRGHLPVVIEALRAVSAHAG